MSETVLVVDDEAAILESVSGILQDEGFGVVTAAHSRDAMAAMKQCNPSLVLLDVWMPDEDGLTLLTRLKALQPNIPVILITGHGTIDTAVRALRLGAVDFLEKPLSLDGLVQAVKGAIGSEVTKVDVLPTSPTVTNRHRGSKRVSSVPQRTVAKSVVIGGVGLHSGVRTGLILQPLGLNEGIRFSSLAGDGVVEAHLDNVDLTGYATTLLKGGMRVRTVEHFMSSLHAYGITNLLVKVEGELPILDGSATEFCELLDSAGVEEQEGTLPQIVIEEPISVTAGSDAEISIHPSEGFTITYELSHPPPVGDQTYTFELDSPTAFRDEIAPARTFGFLNEVSALEEMGLAKGGKLDNVILVSDHGVINTPLRFPEEFARHKILDIMGDFYLLGRPISGSIHARKTGHTENIALLRKIRETLSL
ncbi:MAG TPA: UDP-3-O-[3-hydroxymyristoyl] N-acetylglucosamine deacetylase [Nitrospirales bacterium]|nr:UDP-3-O-[3-hydroxymyristoyl] N-acetylglucosamine deacetylase [Nitrospirales bacterium]